ncbi:MAG: sugar ABC transporter ATP-binding protein, partial [Bacillales bacterium]
AYQPDKGEIYLFGEKVEIKDVNHAVNLGISVIYQELSLSPNMTVAENIFAMREPTRYGIINDKEMNRQAKKLLDELEIHISPTKQVSELSISNQQMVEIAKALSRNPKIIIMDEPTSALSSKETELLFGIIRKLKRNGTSVIYISHRMEEIFEVSDRISVLRDGKYIGTVETASADPKELIVMMVGREMSQFYPQKDFKFVRDEKLLEIKNYTKNGYYHNINFFIKPGEILGMYGLMGSGRTEIAKGIFGLLKKDQGEMLIRGRKVQVDSPISAINHKIAFVTEDRKNEGLVLTANICENSTFANLDKILNKFRLISPKKESEITKGYVDNLRIKTPNI